MKHIVVTANDVLGTSISGRGLRALGIAGALAKEHHVTLHAGRDPGSLLPSGVDVALSQEERRSSLAAAGVAVTANELSTGQMVLFRGHLVADLYDPRMFQLLDSDLDVAARRKELSQELAGQRRLWAQADILLCATSAQRDAYLGASLATLSARRLAVTGSALDRYVVALPSGIDQQAPIADDGLRARLGLTPDDIVLVWGGALWDWMQPELVLDALEQARVKQPALRLFIMALRREGQFFSLASRSETVIARLDTMGHAVVVNDAWVPPQERGGYLLASDAQAFAQRPGLEAHFSFRNRLVDSVWAGLPVIATAGDPITGAAERDGWALLSRPNDVGALAANLVRFAADADLRVSMRTAARAARPAWTWDAVTRPLLEAIDRLPTSGRLRRLWRGVDAVPGQMLSRAVARAGETRGRGTR